MFMGWVDGRSWAQPFGVSSRELGPFAAQSGLGVRTFGAMLWEHGLDILFCVNIDTCRMGQILFPGEKKYKL